MELENKIEMTVKDLKGVESLEKVFSDMQKIFQVMHSLAQEDGIDNNLNINIKFEKEKGSPNNPSKEKINENFLQKLEEKFKLNMQRGLGYNISQWEFENILNKYR